MDKLSRQCANCGKFAALHCFGCAEGLSSSFVPFKTYYCSTTCQRTNFKAHKSRCRVANGRKQLVRGAELVQEVWYAFCEIAFDLPPTDIKVENGKIHFSLPMDQGDSVDPNDWPLCPFPKDALSNIEDQRALLVWNSCDDCFALMHELLQKVLKGTFSASCTSKFIDEYSGLIKYDDISQPTGQCMVMKEEHKTIIRHLAGGVVEHKRYRHTILKICLKDTEKYYIIDPAGAQSRQYRAILPYDEYVDAWVMIQGEKNYFGYYDQRWKAAVENQNDPILRYNDIRVMMTHLETVKCVNRVIEGWEDEIGEIVGHTLEKKNDKFEEYKATIIEDMVEDMQAWLDQFKAQQLRSGESAVKAANLPG